MPVYSDEAIVLRTHKLAEADRIITLLTRDHGVVRAVANGVRRTSSKFGSRLEPFTHVDLQLVMGRNLDRIKEAETRAPYGDRISGNYERYAAASVMAETAEKIVVEERQPARQQYLLLVGATRAMAVGEHRSTDILNSFLLRSLAVAGYAPSCAACAHCGEIGPHRWFNPAAGGALCSRCRIPGSASPAAETMTLLGALLAGDWSVIDAAEQRHRREARGLVANYVTWHLDRGLRSLQYVVES